MTAARGNLCGSFGVNQWKVTQVQLAKWLK